MAQLVEERDAALAEEVAEARSRADMFAHGACAVIEGSSRRRAEIDGQITSMGITLDCLESKLADAHRGVTEAEHHLKHAVQAVVDSEASPLLSQMYDCENAAAGLRRELRALAHTFGIAPQGLSDRLAGRPANHLDPSRPLPWPEQKSYDARKLAWKVFADALRDDVRAQLQRD